MSAADLFHWPDSLLQDLLSSSRGEERLTQLLMNFQNVIILDTHFSGIDAPAQSLTHLLASLRKAGHDTGRGFCNRSACDINAKRRLLLRQLGKSSPDHVFCNLLDRLPDVARVELEKQDSISGMVSILEASFHSGAFGDNLHANCESHGKQCACYATGGPPNDSLQLVVAGVVCRDFSNMGLKRGLQGPNAASLLVWCYERRRRLEDIILIENVPQFADEGLSLILSILGPYYRVARTLD
jgi:hypothetical protein